MITPPGGGAKVPYTRTTTFIKALDDASGLIDWKAGLVALGMAQHDDLRHEVISNRDDAKAVRRVASEAADRAGGKTARERGSALHAMTEDVDAGRDPWGATDADHADLAAYRTATQGIEWLHTEQALVCDTLKVAGTADRIGRLPDGTVAVFDVKTGPDTEKKVVYKGQPWSAQLALYATSDLYDVATGTRTDNPSSTEYGYIIWLPAGQARCVLYRVALGPGWDACQLAWRVREWRSRRDLMDTASIPATPVDLAAITDIDELRGLWSRRPELRDAISVRVGELAS
jgi:hypothetical protein